MSNAVKQKQHRTHSFYRKRVSYIVSRGLLYTLLIELSFVFLLPLIVIITKAPKTVIDQLNPVISWIPSSIQWSNFTEAANLLEYSSTLPVSLLISIIAAFFQTIMCAVAGYSLGRYKYVGSRILYVLLILCIIIPPQTMVINQMAMYSKFKMNDTLLPVILPELFGHGLRGALFVLISAQFFKKLPLSLEEAARIDGASAIRLFGQIMLPLAKPALVLTAIFSFVWHWNDTYTQTMFLSSNKGQMSVMVKYEIITNPVLSSSFGTHAALNTLEREPVKMACALLAIAPLIIFYLIFQKQFTEGVERSGLVE